jgi:Zn-dependent M28 family amino/carboxypeptidase
MSKYLFLFILTFFTSSISEAQQRRVLPQLPIAPTRLLAKLDSVTVRTHLERLSSDEMEGRGTGTRGEERATRYIADEMRRLGLKPMGENGTFFQNVPMLGSTPKPVGNLRFSDANGKSFEADFVNNFTASTDLDKENVKTEGDLVFVGFGIDAGTNWNDFKGVDVRGKILVAFVNDPPSAPFFKGDTLTYYGRWTYKHEEARRKGAKGIILIHTTPTASYPFVVLGNSAPREQIQLATLPQNPLELKSWITEQKGKELAQMAGTTLEQWFVDANSPNFKPKALNIKANVEVNYTVRRFNGTNVMGRLNGLNRSNEAIIFTAHHDHLGIGKADRDGDTIYNGAVDNASGVAMLLTMAKAFSESRIPLERSLLFVTFTAEESGLLGAGYYANFPAMPMSKTIANLNTDSGNLNGRTRDLSGLGSELSDLLPLFRQVAAREHMTISPDPNPNAGLFFRSDQLALARMGVPALFLNTGKKYLNRPANYYKTVEDAYTAAHYHQPSDEFDPTWQMNGLIQQMRVCARLGYGLAATSFMPEWKSGAEFEAARKASLMK